MSLLTLAFALILGWPIHCTDAELVTYETWMRRTPIHSWGYAVWYAPYVMEATAQYRDMSLEGYVDGIATMSPADLGREVWIRRIKTRTEPTWNRYIWGHPNTYVTPEWGVRGEWEGPFLVVDMAQQNHACPAVQNNKEVIEVGYTTAKRWGMVDSGGVKYWRTAVEVSFVPPCNSIYEDWSIQVCWQFPDPPTYFPDWWMSRAEVLP